MDKKKISMIAVVTVVIVSLVLGFNSIFTKAKTSEKTNDTVVSTQSIKTNDEVNKEEKEIEVDNTETEEDNKENKDNKESEAKTSEKNEDTTKVSSKSDTNSSQSTNSNSETVKPSNSQTTKPSNSETTKPSKPSDTTTSEQPKKQTVTIAISCKTAINNGINNKPGFTHLPSSGIILSTMEVEFDDGDTVFDVLVKATRNKGIHMEYTGSGSSIYIEGISNLYEFDGGADSGWMYSVNGVYPNYGVGAYKVKSSDVIKFNYTCNLGEDLGAKRN